METNLGEATLGYPLMSKVICPRKRDAVGNFKTTRSPNQRHSKHV